MDLFETAAAQAKQLRDDMGYVSEAQRILDLPSVDLYKDAQQLVDKWSKALRKHPDAPPLRPIQAIGLEMASIQAAKPNMGLFGNVGVGKGKTLLFALLTKVFDAQRACLFVPADKVDETIADHFEWSEHYWFKPPQVVSYAALSRSESSAMLREMNPDLIMADECQAFSAKDSARTRRMLRYMKKNQDTRFVALSGTITKRSIKDYAHLAELCLRHEAPVPLEDSVLDYWSSVMDADGEPDRNAWMSMKGLIDSQLPGTAHSVAAARQAFQARMAATPGFICTRSPSCDAEIVINGLEPTLKPELLAHINALKEEYVLPDGTELVDAIHHSRALRQLSLGFYYSWDWEDGVVDEDWVEARRNWASEVRRYLQVYSREGCDSPFLVERYVEQHRKPTSLVLALEAWKEQRVKDKPPTVANWVDYGPLMEAVNWAMDRERAIVWFRSRAVGHALMGFGIPTFWEGLPDPRTTPVCALSINVYHKGKNLQAWNDQLVMEPPPSGDIWEQLLGRTHRQGQTANRITADVFLHTKALKDSFYAAVERARYIEQSMNQEQKLLLAKRLV